MLEVCQLEPLRNGVVCLANTLVVDPPQQVGNDDVADVVEVDIADGTEIG